ncbi:hypothetical protein DSECCO2_507130 [anaerobic digester metagenome]
MGKYQQKPKTKDKGLITLLAILTLVIAVAGLIYLDTFYGAGRIQSYFSNVFQSKESGQSAEVEAKGKIQLDESSRSTFAVFGSRFLLSTKDGVKYFNGIGDRKWNDTFNMTIPQLISEGSYAAVGDMNGKTVRVYGENGLLYMVQTEGTLIQFALNKNGYLSVITKGDTAYSVQIYNAGGTLLKGRIEESAGIFPLCSDVSDDNKSFAISYLDTSDIQPTGRVLFFYVNPDDSENLTDSMFAVVEKNDEVIPIIGFMQGGVLAAVSDREIYGISSVGQETWSYPLENRLAQVSLTNKNYVVLAMGDSIANKDGREKGTICWIDSSGKESASYKSGGGVDYLQASEHGVVIGVDKIYSGIKNSGRLAWSYRTASDVRDILPMEQLEEVMLVTKGEALITQMKGTQTARPIISPEGETEPEVVEGTTDKNNGTPEDSAPSSGNEKKGDDKKQVKTGAAQ